MTGPQIVRFSLALIAELLFCAALNLFDDWTLEQMPVRFVAVGIACGVAYLVAIGNFPVSISPRKQAFLFWGVAIALRLVVLPLAPGDDFWRYQWEGKIQQAGFNPYTHAPDDPELDSLRADFPYWYKINHRDFRAIYPPAAELLFLGLSRVSDNPLLYKLLFAAADLATAAVLLRLLARSGDRAVAGIVDPGNSTRPTGISDPGYNAPPSERYQYASAASYAWNPLVVYCFAGSAHFDSLMILPMLAGILFLTKFEAANTSRDKWLLALSAAALFGVAISIKLIPLLLLPLCVFALGFRAITLLVSLGIPALLSMLYGFPKLPIWDSLTRFAHVTRLNDLFWWIIEETVWPNPRQKNYHYNVVIVVAVVLVSLIFCRNWRRGMLWGMSIALILTPVLHPWYCTWILPLAAWRRAEPWLVLSVTLFAYFLFWNERLFSLPWRSELWLRAIIIVPPLIATLFFLSRTPAEEPVPDPA